MKYRKIVTKNGRVMFFVDGKMTKAENVADHIKEQLEDDKEVELDDFEAPQLKVPSTKECGVCGEPATKIKYIGGYLFGICKDHYYGYTLGKLTQLIRERGKFDI